MEKIKIVMIDLPFSIFRYPLVLFHVPWLAVFRFRDEQTFKVEVFCFFSGALMRVKIFNAINLVMC